MSEQEDIQDSKDFVKAKQTERKERKSKKKLDFLRRILRFLFCCGIIAVIILGSRLKGWYFPSHTFKSPNNRVIIVNNNIIKTAKVRAVLQDVKVPKVPVYMMRVKPLKKRLATLEPLDSVYIRRFAFPARVMIIIKEKTPFVSVAYDEKSSPVAVFMTDGKLITGSDYLPLPKEYKTILVLTKPNGNYKTWNLNKIKEIEKLVSYVQTFSNDTVEYIDYRDDKSLYVKTKSVKIKLGEQDKNMYERLKRLPSIMPEAKKVKNLQYIDLSWEKVNFLKLGDVKNENGIGANKI